MLDILTPVTIYRKETEWYKLPKGTKPIPPKVCDLFAQIEKEGGPICLISRTESIGYIFGKSQNSIKHEPIAGVKSIEFEPGELLTKDRDGFTWIRKIYERCDRYASWMYISNPGNGVILCTDDTKFINRNGDIEIPIFSTDSWPSEHFINNDYLCSVYPTSEATSFTGYDIETESGNFLVSNLVLYGGSIL